MIAQVNFYVNMPKIKVQNLLIKYNKNELS